MEAGDSPVNLDMPDLFLTPISSPWTLAPGSKEPGQVFLGSRCTGVLFADLLGPAGKGATRHPHPGSDAEKMGPLIRAEGRRGSERYFKAKSKSTKKRVEK